MSERPVEDVDSDFGANVIENFFVTWVEPELVSRGLAADRVTIWAALVELPSRGEHTVFLNEEVQVAAKAKLDAGVERGTTLTAENLESLDHLIPLNVDPDSGWLVYVNIDGRGYLEFDFRYNKQRIRELLSLASEYLATAEVGYSTAPRPAIDNLFSAAELTVQAQMTSGTEHTQLRSDHSKAQSERANWLKSNVTLGNVPAEHKQVLDLLKRERNAARYGDHPTTLGAVALKNKIEAVAAMIRFARERTGVATFE
ncbi:hypothetical protein ACX80L_15685 [Arthrobacter sp. MDT1-48-3]